MEVVGGQAEEVGEGAVAVEDAQDGAVAAVAAEPGEAEVAAAADGVDLADDALTHELFPRRLCNLTHELVAEDTAEAHVPIGDFEVGRADAGLPNAHEALAVGGGLGVTRAE